jgi:glycosyltransferase involved in cell wall biosynthesis
MRLRVAIVAPTLGILGGQAVQADQLLRGWQRDPAVHAWLVPINPPPPGALRFAVRVKYLRTLVTECLYVPRLVREIWKADLVHVFSASYSSFVLAPLPAIAIARAMGRPVVLNYHSGEAPDHLDRSAVARRVLRTVERIVVPSPFLAAVFARFGLDASVIPNTIDPERFAYRVRRPLRPRILSTRNLDDPYNVACTLRAFRLVQDQWPDASITVVGGGAHERRLRLLADELRLAHVRFAGRVHPSRIHEYYAGHDIYLQSPDIDNMPLSVLEAFASGLPVVSTDAGGVPYLVPPEMHGLLAPVGDHRALAAQVLRLLADPDLARQLAAAANAACQSYCWPAVRQRWLAVYQTTVRSAVAAPVMMGGRTS